MKVQAVEKKKHVLSKKPTQVHVAEAFVFTSGAGAFDWNLDCTQLWVNSSKAAARNILAETFVRTHAGPHVRPMQLRLQHVDRRPRNNKSHRTAFIHEQFI